MTVKTYDPKQIIVICGAFPLSGFSDGSVVSIAFNEDAWVHSVGCDAEGTRSKSNNFSAEATISLMQTSDANQLLSDFHEADRIGNAGSFPFLVTDVAGNSLYTTQSAWIKKMPDSGFEREAGAREWVISLDNLIANIGGN